MHYSLGGGGLVWNVSLFLPFQINWILLFLFKTENNYKQLYSDDGDPDD